MRKIILLLLAAIPLFAQTQLKINDKEYFEMPGVNVMVFHDYYPEGHQTGITLVHNGNRVAANGDLRLEATPGQWSPTPVVGKRTVDKEKNEISVSLSYPDPRKDKKGFNPIDYPDLKFTYTLRVKAEGSSFRIFVDFDSPLPDEWIGKVGFNLELFPGEFFGKSFIIDKNFGVFPRQANGPMFTDEKGVTQQTPIAEGNKLVVSPENEEEKITFESIGEKLFLIDGRGKHNNGWFIIRSLIPVGKTKSAIEWLVTPGVNPNWISKPVVQISQVGFHPAQSKIAVIELDKNDSNIHEAELIKIDSEKSKVVLSDKPKTWGKFLRYNYLQFDFSKVRDEGIYQIRYGDFKTDPFQISKSVYQKNVWQPTIEYFLPGQMCHMRVEENYRVWHGLCHDDDALMAPINYNHFDGYSQGPSTLTKYKPLDHVPNLNYGGWHDAGDYDLRIESQSETVHLLGMAYEEFKVDYDQTTIDQKNKLVKIHVPDGKSDIFQQMEHGLLTIINGYKSLGRLYRGIICPTLSQYTLLGDASVNTDNHFYDPSLKENEVDGNRSGKKDDDYVFTENNPMHELGVASTLAQANRVLQNYNLELAAECLRIAEELWNTDKDAREIFKIEAAAELYLTTGKDEYKNFLLSNTDLIANGFERSGWIVGRVLSKLNNDDFSKKMNEAAKKHKTKLDELQKENPYGVPYRPDIWGAGWQIQSFGKQQYYLQKSFPEVFTKDYMLNALNFVLGCHPGQNTSSFVSGVGAKSATVAYGVNRADWSYIPGGIVSGTAIIRPDLPELKVWPYFWQQTEYVLGGGTGDYIFLVLAADKILNQ